jgi:hypothetical protein
MITQESNVLNANIPNLKLKVRRSFLTKKDEDCDEFDNCYAFGIQSIAGKILTFHIMTDYGMLRSRVPISELYYDKPESDIPSDFKQLWDCFSENVSVIEYLYLAEKRCQVALKDKRLIWATYLFTVDWFSNPYSDEPSDYKCGHILVSDDGYLLCQPNNRIFWRDSNWITKNFPMEKSELKVDTELESVESKSDRWVSADSNCYYYDINEKKENPNESTSSI